MSVPTTAPEVAASAAVTETSRPRVLSGIQPTADSFHFGNYLGALRQWVDLQEDYQPFFFIADMHAITVEQDPKVAARALPAGRGAADRDGRRPGPLGDLRPEPDPGARPAELGAPVPDRLRRGPPDDPVQGQVRQGRRGAASVGLFTYPILQAADILLYRPHFVPVGEDQRQHLELTRDLAQRFNHRYKKTFRLPEPYILKAPRRSPTFRTRRRRCRSRRRRRAASSRCSTTREGERQEDPLGGHRLRHRGPLRPRGQARRLEPAHHLLSSLSGRGDRRPRGGVRGRGYGDLKKDLAEVVVEFVTPFRRRPSSCSTTSDPHRRPRHGAERARAVAEAHPARRLPPGRLRAPPRARSRVDGVPTIGVAVAIPEPWATELQDYRASVGDTTATVIPTHITLVPPTEVDEADRRDRRAPGEVAAVTPPFRSTCAAPARSGRSRRWSS